MAIEITVPRLGWNMEQGVFLGWLKKDGDAVKPGDPIFTLEGDKSAQEVEATDAGILRIAAEAPATGDTVAVGSHLGYLAAPGEELPAAPPSGAAPAVAEESNGARENAPPAGPAVRQLARQHGVDLAQVTGSGRSGRIHHEDVLAARATPDSAPAQPASTPRARRVGKELGVDWTGVEGSGHRGRVRERDVRAAASGSPVPSGARSIPVTTTRQIIARRMTASQQTTAPVTLTTTVDATNLVNLRAQFKALSAADQPVPGYLDFLIKLTALALGQHPHLNSSWADDRILLHEEVNMGIAVDTDNGLFVPVVHGVTSLGVRQIATRTRTLIDKVRARQLASADAQGGTFTITNLGSFGIDAFTPIINTPECAILGLGRIQRQPAVIDERIVPRDMLTLSLTFDHRIVDGAPAARFLDTVRKLTENPAPLLMA